MAREPLLDGHGRRIRDLRVSVTDRCNFRCQYCMPADGLPWLERDEILRAISGSPTDLHPVLLVKILGDASDEDVERIKALVHDRLPVSTRVRAEALWEAAEMIWSGQMDIAHEEPGLHPGGAGA
jgi:hypothetical protein